MKALFAPLAFVSAANGQILPGTKPLDPNPDFSATMVSGVDKFLLRETANAKAA